MLRDVTETGQDKTELYNLLLCFDLTAQHEFATTV